MRFLCWFFAGVCGVYCYVFGGVALVQGQYLDCGVFWVGMLAFGAAFIRLG